MTRRVRLGIGAAFVLALAIAGSTSSETGVTATIRVFQFQPGTLEVRGGSRVTWLNEDDITHTVTSGVPGRPDGRFDIELAGKGTRGSALLSEPGPYPYFCGRHPSMRGEIFVR